jgi:hypothetical protein
MFLSPFKNHPTYSGGIRSHERAPRLQKHVMAGFYVESFQTVFQKAKELGCIKFVNVMIITIFGDFLENKCCDYFFALNNYSLCKDAKFC